MVYCIGLTGSIGSGKSTAADFFASLGVAVISADKIAKTLTLKNAPAFHDIVTHFGPSILTADGELNRHHLRQLIFKNTEDRLWLENCLHPLIREQIKQAISHINAPYCIIEIPLLKDKSLYPYLKRVLLIQTSPTLQLSRLMTRDHSTQDDILAIMATQQNHETTQKNLADDIIINSGSRLALKHQIAALHTQYLQYAG